MRIGVDPGNYCFDKVRQGNPTVNRNATLWHIVEHFTNENHAPP